MRAMKKTDQLLLRPDVDLIAELRALAETYGYESGSKVALEVLERYLPFWIETKKAEFERLEEQKRAGLGKVERLPLQKGAKK